MRAIQLFRNGDCEGDKTKPPSCADGTRLINASGTSSSPGSMKMKLADAQN